MIPNTTNTGSGRVALGILYIYKYICLSPLLIETPFGLPHFVSSKTERGHLPPLLPLQFRDTPHSQRSQIPAVNLYLVYFLRHSHI